ncbi:protein kinase [Cordyceps javanica]|uniref:non-specific serine/threonine protein kinase n=1 Tax=Cordyceps javanica TaxID=43265 RepID=A0A545ULA2_9HYPO|nr:protein kinase [Cordyceps javanica]TQW01566.1 protein kinase [Cordyceps javanica]
MDRPDGAVVPLREVITTPLVSDMASLHVRIIDFGVVTIGAPWDTGVDIWSLGCLVVEFVQGIALFTGTASEKGSWTAEDDHLAKIVEALGPFPSSLLERGSRSGQFFDEQGKLIRIRNLKPTSLERLLNGEAKPFKKPPDMLETEMPRARKSAAQLLQHEWLS